MIRPVATQSPGDARKRLRRSTFAELFDQFSHRDVYQHRSCVGFGQAGAVAGGVHQRLENDTVIQPPDSFLKFEPTKIPHSALIHEADVAPGQRGPIKRNFAAMDDGDPLAHLLLVDCRECPLFLPAGA